MRTTRTIRTEGRASRRLSLALGLAFAWSIGAAAAQGAKLSFEPNSGTVGAPVTATATGLVAGETYELVWTSAEASWNVADGKFFGITAEGSESVIGRFVADAAGSAQATFVVPEDYGYMHNVFVQRDGQEVARQGFVVVPDLSISPASGPAGTPITITMTGVGYRFWESVWHLLYDGAHTGWLSAVTTRGTATAVIPATGGVGPHTLQVLSGTHPVPYLNQQQAPIYNPYVPTVIGAVFELQDGPPVAWPALGDQGSPRRPGTAASSGGTSLTADHLSGAVGSPLILSGSGFPPDSPVELTWSTVRGNRLSGAGWEVVDRPLGNATADGSGAFSLRLDTPDDLGGAHSVTATSGDRSAVLTYTITPSLVAAPVGPVRPGGDITITLKGVGWTETANIYTLLLDNGYLGYGCGFNSQGDVTIHLKAPGRSGTHFISLYPAIYQGELTGPGAPASTATANATYLQVPMLNWRDHPGEELPAFHFSFEVE